MKRRSASGKNLYYSKHPKPTMEELYFGAQIRYNKLAIVRLKKKQKLNLYGNKRMRQLGVGLRRRPSSSSLWRKGVFSAQMPKRFDSASRPRGRPKRRPRKRLGSSNSNSKRIYNSPKRVVKQPHQRQRRQRLLLRTRIVIESHRPRHPALDSGAQYAYHNVS